MSPLGTLLPTVDLLRNVGIPLGVLLGFAAMLAWLGVRAARHFRSLRQKP